MCSAVPSTVSSRTTLFGRSCSPGPVSTSLLSSDAEVCYLWVDIQGVSDYAGLLRTVEADLALAANHTRSSAQLS